MAIWMRLSAAMLKMKTVHHFKIVKFIYFLQISTGLADTYTLPNQVKSSILTRRLHPVSHLLSSRMNGLLYLFSLKLFLVHNKGIDQLFAEELLIRVIGFQ